MAYKSYKNLFESLETKYKKNITPKKYAIANVMSKNKEHCEGTNRKNEA